LAPQPASASRPSMPVAMPAAPGCFDSAGYFVYAFFNGKI